VSLAKRQKWIEGHEESPKSDLQTVQARERTPPRSEGNIFQFETLQRTEAWIWLWQPLIIDSNMSEQPNCCRIANITPRRDILSTFVKPVNSLQQSVVCDVPCIFLGADVIQK